MNLRRIDTLLRWAAMDGIVLLMIVIAVFAYKGPQIVGAMAEYVVGHSAQPKGEVYPATPYLPMQSTAEVAALGGRAEGISCSLPSIAESFFDDAPAGVEQSAPNASVNLQFRQACFRHDYCYRHGAATYGYTQLDCDNFLAEDAARLCVQIMRKTDDPAVTEKRLAWCQTRARKVLLGVMAGGAAAFREEQPNHRYQVKDPTHFDVQSEVSTRLEYDPYPSVKSDGEHFALRLVEWVKGCAKPVDKSKVQENDYGPAVISYRRQSAGQMYSFRCIYVDVSGTTPDYSLTDAYYHPPTTAETNRIVGTPWLTQSGLGGNGKATFALSQWCRDFQGPAEPITGGFFTSTAPGKEVEPAQADEEKEKSAKSGPKYSPKWALPCNQDWATVLKEKPAQYQAQRSIDVEADSIAYFPMPVAQNFGVDALFQNIVWDGTQFECTAWAVPRLNLPDGLKIQRERAKREGKKIPQAPNLVEFAPKSAFPAHHTLLQRDPIATQGQSADCYRWFATAPQFVVEPNARAMKMLFFRRGAADGADYADTLDVMMRDYDATGFTGQPTYARLDVNEMQEPFIALPHASHGAALLSISRDDLAAKGLLTIWLGIRLLGAIALTLVVYFIARADFGIPTQCPIVDEKARATVPAGDMKGDRKAKLLWVSSRWHRYRGGSGFAAVAFLGCLVWIAIAASNRDDVTRATKLGTSVTLNVWPIASKSKPIRIPWDQLSPSRQQPARYLQNRISVVPDATGGHYLLAPRIATMTDESCSITVELAVIHLAKNAQSATVQIAERKLDFGEKQKSGECPTPYASFPAQMAILPFRYSKPAETGGDAALNVLILHTRSQGMNTFVQDIGALQEPVLHLSAI